MRVRGPVPTGLGPDSIAFFTHLLKITTKLAEQPPIRKAYSPHLGRWGKKFLHVYGLLSMYHSSFVAIPSPITNVHQSFLKYYQFRMVLRWQKTSVLLSSNHQRGHVIMSDPPMLTATKTSSTVVVSPKFQCGPELRSTPAF